jgi:trk system potassium uptake protein TrkA
MATYVIVVGGGKVGTYLALFLLGQQYRVKVIENRRELIPKLEARLRPASGEVVLGSGTDPNVLEAAGIRQANVVAAVTGADEANLVVTSLARFEFGVPRTISRVNNPSNAWMFTAEMGVDVALNQADLMAHLIAEEMSLGDMMTLLKLRRGQYSLVEEKVG